jgi:Flp pilus assembly protein TadG
MRLLNPPARAIRDRSGQAFVEFVFEVMILAVLLFGLIDVSRFLTTRQTLINVSREGSNLSLRQTSLSNAVAAVIASASPLTIGNTGSGPKGRVIITEVTSINNVNRITDQYAQGGLTTVSSKFGTGINTHANMQQAGVTGIPLPGDKVYITEVYYTFQPITPIGKLVNIALPTQFYDVAYFL